VKLLGVYISLIALVAPPIASYASSGVQQAYIKASNTQAEDHFGTSVALSGNTAVVGAPYESSAATGANGNQADNSATYSGAAYVFVRHGTNWHQQAYLKPSNTEASDSFGSAVAISGDTIVIGAPNEASDAMGVNGDDTNNNLAPSGAAYVFVRTATNWVQQAYLKASNTGLNDAFGSSVAISGETIVVGAPGEGSNATGINGNQNDDSAAGAGAAYVFVRNGTNWSQQAYVKASNTDAGDMFGFSVAISDGTVVVGAIWEASNAIGVNGNESDNSTFGVGAAYVFERDVTTWSQRAYLKPSITARNQVFGRSAAVSGDTVVVGAPQETDAGAAYVFLRNGSNWAQQARLTASNAENNDMFGFAVSIWGNTVIIGAPWESSQAIGVNGDATNNLAPYAGGAYQFVRNGTDWNQDAYLKASNTDAGDSFGNSVAVSCDTVLVAAYREASGAVGVNGNQNDNSAWPAGAGYIFSGFGNGPRLAIIRNSGGGYLIRFTGAPGFMQKLQRALDVTGPWNTIEMRTAPLSGLVEYEDASPASGQTFYRVIQP
jgi:hypothetical protein